MVFGNLGEDCLTGVALSRNGTTGENLIEGDYLKNAQGEDVVAGIRQTNDISQLKDDMPEIYAEFEQTVKALESHYRDMQDIEFTVEKGKLWILQTRDGKRTAQAAVRIAVEMAEEELISQQEAVLRITPEQVDFFLHPQFDREAKAAAQSQGSHAGHRPECFARCRRRDRRLRCGSGGNVGQRTEKSRSSWCALKPNRMMSTACWPPRGF